jgi:indolepyruvate ferredoxin oxidoreductase
LFGKTEERQHERQMMQDYITQIDEVVSKLDERNYAAAVQLACIPDEIRGFGHVKTKSIEAAQSLREKYLQEFRKLNSACAGSSICERPAATTH